MLRANIYLICALASSPGEIGAQNPAFRTETNVVQVPVSVTGTNGRDVEGLSARDFVVRDNGVPRTVAVDIFGPRAAPISLVVAVQSAGVSTPALKKIQRVGGMIQPLVIGTRGEAAVVTFDREIAWVQDFTSDPAEIRTAFRNLKPFKSNQAHMLDAIVEVAERMRERKGRRVLLIVSESRDRGSKAEFEEAMEAVQREGVEIFGAALVSLDGPDRNINAIQSLTEATGGSDYPFLGKRGIEKAIEKLGVEVHSQYIVSFPLPEGAQGTHRIDVAVPEHADYRIRARQAYRAP